MANTFFLRRNFLYYIKFFVLADIGSKKKKKAVIWISFFLRNYLFMYSDCRNVLLAYAKATCFRNLKEITEILFRRPMKNDDSVDTEADAEESYCPCSERQTVDKLGSDYWKEASQVQ